MEDKRFDLPGNTESGPQPDDPIFGEPISVYTADQAVEDGVLVKVDPKLSLEAGFKIPVRITAGVHGLCEVPEGNTVETYQGRLRDVLDMGAWAIHMKGKKARGPLEFKVKIGNRVHTLWVCLDGTSGVAFHIIMPEEY